MSSRRGFLDLPLHIRQRIYADLGLRGKVIDLNWVYDEVSYPDDGQHEPFLADYVGCWHSLDDVLVKREEYHPQREYWHSEGDQYDRIRTKNCKGCCETEDCFRWDSDYWLLFTCKTLFHEISKLIYRENRFVVDRAAPRGFERLLKLGHTSVRMLTHLTIRLDGEPPETIDLSDHWSRTAALRPMKHYSRYGKQAYKEWNALITLLRDAKIPPGQLSLFLIASVPNVHEAKHVLQPLHSLPSLKGCGIWLNYKLIPALTDLVKSTVEILTTRKEGEVQLEDPTEEVIPFRYLDLPPEIRTRILTFTSLRAASDLEWKPINSLLDRIDPISSAKCDCYQFEEHIGKGIHFDDCMEVDTVVPRIDGNGLEWEPEDPKHCCSCASERFHWERYGCKLNNDPHICIFDCESHSSYVKTGRPGWKPYCDPLFLVSHQVRQDAIPVFFKHRHLVITSLKALPLRHLKRNYGCYRDWCPSPSIPRTELSLFLSSMPKSALRHIRRLEWILPATEHYLGDLQKTGIDYHATIELMVQAMTLSNLTLIINMRPKARYNDEYDSWGGYYWPGRTRSDAAVYDAVLRPLCRLGEHGLKNCWVYLRMVWLSRHDHGQCRDISEIIWERRITGNEHYDSYERGKPFEDRIERETGDHPRGPGGYAEYVERYPSR